MIQETTHIANAPGEGDELRVLLIEDSADDAEILLHDLKENGFKIRASRVDTQNDLEQSLVTERWDLVLCDYNLPRLDAESALRTVRGYSDSLPFIIVSGHIDDDTAIGLMKNGAQDYLKKDNLARLSSVVHRELDHVVVLNERHAARSRVSILEQTDTLTGLSNRDHFVELLNKVLTTPNRDSTNPLAVVAIDIDGLGLLNHSYGYGLGDRLLATVGEVAQGHSISPFLATRMGEGQFALVLEGSTPQELLAKTLNVCRDAEASAPVEGATKVSFTCSAGLAIYPEHGDAAIPLLDAAEFGLSEAKAKGRGSASIYDPGDGNRNAALELQQARSLVMDAIETDRLLLMKQPICSTSDNSPTHWEILTRIIDAEGGIRQPREFFPQAEQLNLAPALDRAIIDRALRGWKKHSEKDDPIRITLNVSARSIGSDMAEFIIEAADKYGAPHDDVTIEITETATFADEDSATLFNESLSTAGFRLAMDDFGSGSTSLRRLTQLRFDVLKLDGDIVRDIVNNVGHREYVASLVALARSQGIETVAEFVDSQELLETLTQLGVDYVQGYHLGVPVLF